MAGRGGPQARDRCRWCHGAQRRSRAGSVATVGPREFFTVRTVAEALGRASGPGRRTAASRPVALARARLRAGSRPQPVTAPHALPGFARSTVDGYAVRAADTYGASEGLPGYLEVTGAVRDGTQRRCGGRARDAR